MNSSPIFHLRLFGSPALARADGSLVGGRAAQRHRLALLALLAHAPDRRLSREKLIGYLWPEANVERGRNLLNVSTYVLRASLTEAALISEGEDLRLHPDLIRSDTTDFEAALERNDHEQAAALYSAPFLDGFFVSGAPEFEQWTTRERQRLADAYAASLEKLAAAAETSGELDKAAHWWKARARHDSYDSRVALRLMEALDACGNRAGALNHASLHGRLLQQEFGVDVPLEIRAFAERLRQSLEAKPLPRPTPGNTPERDADPVLPIGKADGISAALPSADGVGRNVGQRRRTAPAALFAIVVLSAAVWLIWPRGAEPTVEPEARELYRRGRYHWTTRTKEGHQRAIEYYQQAINRDSGFAAPWAGLAETYLTGYQLGMLEASETEAYSRIKWAAERALALDDGSAEAHASLGVVLWWQRNWPGAERELRRAIALDPNHASAHSWYALLLSGVGRADEALRESRRGYELDPFALIISLTYAWQCRIARDYDCAIRQYQRTLEINSSWTPTWDGLALSYAEKGMRDEAIRAMTRAIELSPESRYPRVDLAYVHATFGEEERAREILSQWKGKGGEPFHVARAYVALGEADSAFAWLEKSTWVWPHRAVRIDPSLDPIRSDARFARLSAKIDREMGLR